VGVCLMLAAHEFREHNLEKFSRRGKTVGVQRPQGHDAIPKFAARRSTTFAPRSISGCATSRAKGGQQSLPVRCQRKTLAWTRRGSTMNAFIGVKGLDGTAGDGRVCVFVDASAPEAEPHRLARQHGRDAVSLQV